MLNEDLDLIVDWEEPTFMEIIASKLGVDFYVGWLANDGNQYSITPNGVSKYNPETNSWHYDAYALRDIVVYELRPGWNPKIGDSFYTIDLQEPHRMIVRDIWSGVTTSERELLENNLVFDTEELATAALDKILDVLAEVPNEVELTTKIVNSSDDLEENADLYVFDKETLRDKMDEIKRRDKQFNKTDDSAFGTGTVDIKERVENSRGMSSIDEDGRGLDVYDSSEGSLVFDMEVSPEQHGMTATMDLDDLDSFVVYDQPHTIIEPDYEVGLINITVVHEGKSNVDVIKMDSRSGKQLLQLSGLPLIRKAVK